MEKMPRAPERNTPTTSSRSNESTRRTLAIPGARDETGAGSSPFRRRRRTAFIGQSGRREGASQLTASRISSSVRLAGGDVEFGVAAQSAGRAVAPACDWSRQQDTIVRKWRRTRLMRIGSLGGHRERWGDCREREVPPQGNSSQNPGVIFKTGIANLVAGKVAGSRSRTVEIWARGRLRRKRTPAGRNQGCTHHFRLVVKKWESDVPVMASSVISQTCKSTFVGTPNRGSQRGAPRSSTVRQSNLIPNVWSCGKAAVPGYGKAVHFCGRHFPCLVG